MVKLEGSLEIDYSEMRGARMPEAIEFLENLPLTISGRGYGPKLMFREYISNNGFLSLTPEKERVCYEGFENLGRKYTISFSRCGFNDERGLTDYVVVQMKKSPHTGIFLHSGPIIKPEDISPREMAEYGQTRN